MKKKLAFIMAVVLLCGAVLTGCAVTGNQTGAVGADAQRDQGSKTELGGQEEVGEDITDETRAIFEKAVKDTEYASYTPEKLLSVQVVSGKNYSFLCSSPDGARFVLTVYQKLSGKCSVTDVNPYTEE